MAQWTNEYAIHRDLSLVQGRVPVAIDGTVGAGDKPPPLNITEETEEEFFKHCSADADVGAAPDLGLIKKMLDMVRDINVSSDEEDCSKKIVVISKLNPQCSSFKPKSDNTSTPAEQSPKKQDKKEKVIKPKKRQRNVALESIMQAIADDKQNLDVNVTPEPMKLLKPNDFIAKIDDIPVMNDTEDANITPENDVSLTVTKKVTGWFETMNDNPIPKKAPKVLLEPINMFKKKNLHEKVKKVESIKSPSTISSNEEYQPSILASEYYQKYVQRNTFKESVKEDIWSKAEKKMKEIEEKRKREMAEALASPPSTSQSSVNESDTTEDGLLQNPEAAALFTSRTELLTSPIEDARIKTRLSNINRCLDIICLPEHRHSLPEECVVCKVLLK